MNGNPRELPDGRRWNGLAYVHNAPVNGCNCGSCAGYFPMQRRRFVVLDTKTADALGGPVPYAHMALASSVPLTGKKNYRDLEPHESTICEFQISGRGTYRVVRVDDAPEAQP